MSDGTYRGRWIDEVYRTPLVSAEVKVLLLAMGRDMDDAGRVSVPREDLGGLLACHERKVTDKQKTAIDAGLLVRTSSGHRGRTAVFQAAIPERVPTVGTQSPGMGAAPQHPFEEGKGAAPQHPIDGKGADSRHPMGEKGCRQSAPHIHKGEDAGDHATHAVVFQLFNAEDQKPSRKRSHESASGDRFDEFWATYPRKIGKPSGRKAWAKAMKRDADPEQIVLAARRYATDPRRSDADIRYTPHPSTWLNDERYLDEAEAQPARASNGHQPWTNPTDQSVYDEDL